MFSSMTPTLKHIRRALLLLGASWRLDNDTRRIEVGTKDFVAAPHKDALRFLLVKLLNEFEDHYTIRIKGVPFCFMPDAWDHVEAERARNRSFRRIPLCPKCALKENCPGIAVVPQGGAFTENVFSFLRPVPDRPNEIVIEVTPMCNLRCLACFASKKATPAALTGRRIKEVIDETRRLGIANIRLTGGEPLLRPDLPDLLKYAKESGLYVLLNTNATVLPAKGLKALSQYVDNILVSLQGHDAASEERLTRGGRFFPKKIANIRRFIQAGIPVIRCGTVISQTLLKNFDAYTRLLRDLGITHWGLFRPMTVREDADINREYAITPRDVDRLIRKLWLLRRQGCVATIANPVPFCRFPGKARRDLLLLGATFDDGHSRLIRDTQGIFKPSYFIDVPCGREISKAWHHRYRRTLKSFTYLPAACRRCHDLLRCRGGSRLWAHRTAGTYFAKDPWMKT